MNGIARENKANKNNGSQGMKKEKVPSALIGCLKGYA
jgi:hypothetical protein